MNNDVNFKSHPNQRVMLIHRNLPKDGAKDYLCVFNKSLYAAMKTISGEVALKLYIYLLTNKDNYEFWYSPAHFCSACAASPDAARRAMKQLIELGYVKDMGNKHLEFYEEPQIIDLIPSLPSMIERRIMKTTSGGTMLLTYEMVYNQFHGKATDEEISAFWNGLEVYKEEA